MTLGSAQVDGARKIAVAQSQLEQAGDEVAAAVRGTMLGTDLQRAMQALSGCWSVDLNDDMNSSANAGDFIRSFASAVGQADGDGATTLGG